MAFGYVVASQFLIAQAKLGQPANVENTVPAGLKQGHCRLTDRILATYGRHR